MYDLFPAIGIRFMTVNLRVGDDGPAEVDSVSMCLRSLVRSRRFRSGVLVQWRNSLTVRAECFPPSCKILSVWALEGVNYRHSPRVAHYRVGQCPRFPLSGAGKATAVKAEV